MRSKGSLTSILRSKFRRWLLKVPWLGKVSSVCWMRWLSSSSFRPTHGGRPQTIMKSVAPRDQMSTDGCTNFWLPSPTNEHLKSSGAMNSGVPSAAWAAMLPAAAALLGAPRQVGP